MKVETNALWQAGSDLLTCPPENKTSAILAIRDHSKGSYFILPEIFSFDEKLKTFVGDEHGMPQDSDYWYMLETELLSPFNFLN